MDEAIIEPAFPENSENAVDNVNNVDNSLENVESKIPKKGRPAGSKDTKKRVVKPRKITIVEEPLRVEAPEEPVVMKAPRPKAVSIAPQPEVRYVDRYIEHSPRSMMRIAHSHLANEQQSRHDAKREHFANVYTSRLR